MDRYDPNQWTQSFVSENQDFCLRELRETNSKVAQFVEQGNYEPAIAGIDRILNGLVTMLNAGYDYRSQVCFFSWIEAHIILFGVDAPEANKRDIALKALEDARDFAKSDNTKQTLASMISDLRSGRSIEYMKETYDSDFPDYDVQLLNDLNSKLVSSAKVSTASNNNYSAPAKSKGGKRGCLVAIIIVILIAVVGFVLTSIFMVQPAEKVKEPALSQQGVVICDPLADYDFE